MQVLNGLLPLKKLAPVVEIGDQALIYFDNNSSVGKIDPKVEEYLAKLAEIFEKTPKKLFALLVILIAMERLKSIIN